MKKRTWRTAQVGPHWPAQLIEWSIPNQGSNSSHSVLCVFGRLQSVQAELPTKARRGEQPVGEQAVGGGGAGLQHHVQSAHDPQEEAGQVGAVQGGV